MRSCVFVSLARAAATFSVVELMIWADARLYEARGKALLMLDNFTEALMSYQKGLMIDPRYHGLRQQVQLAQNIQRKWITTVLDEAGNAHDHQKIVSIFEQALEKDERALPVLDRLSYLLATTRDDRVRDPARALSLAERSRELSNGASSYNNYLAYATALAASGDFEKAVQVCQEGLALTKDVPELDDFKLRKALEHFERGETWRDPFPE